MFKFLEHKGLFVKMLASEMGAILFTSVLWIVVTTYFLGLSEQAAQVRSLTNHTVYYLAKTRNQEKNVLLRDTTTEAFYTSGDSEALHAYHQSMEALQQTIDSLIKVLGKDSEQGNRIKDAVAAYENTFARLVVKYRELGFSQWGMAGQWDESSRKLERLIQNAGSPNLVQILAEVMRLEKDYLLTYNVAIAADIRAQVNHMRQELDVLDERTRNELDAALVRYLDILGKHQALLEEIGVHANQGLQAEYRAAANVVDPMAMELLKKAVAEYENSYARLYQASVGVALLGLVLGGFIFFYLSRGITRPLGTVAAAAEQIAGGQLTLDVDFNSRKDELGALLKSFQRMVASLRERVAVAKRIADGDLTVSLENVQEQDALGMALQTMIENLKNQVREIKEGVNVLGSSSAEITTAVAQVAASATETATAVTQTMATAEELRQTSELSDRKAAHVSKAATTSSSQSDDGLRAIEQIAEAMGHIRSQMEAIGSSVVALSEQSQVIGEIIGTVDDLTEQSNILSVNASIEAAKAGEHGRGFAVVAQEIKSLAERSKEGTARVRAILTDIQKATSAAVMVTEQGTKAVEAGVSEANNAAQAVRSLAESIGNVDQAAQQIMASSKQQFSGVEQVTAAIENIREATEQNVQSMDQLETSAQALAEIGRRIVALVERYSV